MPVRYKSRRKPKGSKRIPRRRMMRRKVDKLIIPKSMRSINNSVHRFTRYSDQYVDLIPSNGGLTVVAYNQTFNLVDVSGQNDFINLFDQYRIRAVRVEITPTGQYITNDRTVTGAGGLNTEGTGYWVPPMLYAVIDYNDANPLASTQEAQEYASCKVIPYKNNLTKFYFTPCINVAVAQDAAVVVNTGTKFATWISTASANVQHYGMKYLVFNPNANNVASSYGTNRWQIRTKYYLEFKNSK